MEVKAVPSRLLLDRELRPGARARLALHCEPVVRPPRPVRVSY